MDDSNVSLTNKFRSSREILTVNSDLTSTVTVMIGLYNADHYLDDLWVQINSQTQQSIHWLFIDNCSEDSSWQRLRNLICVSNFKITAVRNPVNLGATGSFFTNLDLVETDWLTFMHQDDFYKPTFVETLFDQAEQAGEETILVYGDMGRIDSHGRKLGAYPSAAWVLPDHKPETYFLALIRNHCVPWPALMVRTHIFAQVECPWHSASFPDTEVTLRLLAYGNFCYVPVEVMRYRDNLNSESRSLFEPERQMGSALALLRVFSSDEFGKISSELAKEERKEFVEALKFSLEVRLSEPTAFFLVWTTALERLNMLWAQSDTTVLAHLRQNFTGLGAQQTAALLKRISVYFSEGNLASQDSDVENDGQLLPLQDYGSEKRVSLLLRLYTRFCGSLPHWVRRRLFSALILLGVKNNPLHPWNYYWRR